MPQVALGNTGALQLTLAPETELSQVHFQLPLLKVTALGLPPGPHKLLVGAELVETLAALPQVKSIAPQFQE